MSYNARWVGAAVLLLAACSPEPTSTVQERAARTAGEIDAPYGALEPRLLALDAFAGRRRPVVLRMERHTIEGARIVYRLAVQSGAAALSSDLREDGGGVRTDVMGSVLLVRYVPSRWQGNVEVTKEHFVTVDATAARATPGTYLLVHPRCLTAPCTELF